MPTEAIAALVIVAIGVVFPAADLAIRRRALRHDRNSRCARCNKPLIPMESELVPVAGGMHTPSVALLALIVATCAAAEPTSEDLKADRAALTQWIARENHCDGQRDSVSINRLLYFDFNADGVPELVVTASSCNTGNAGPDIHAVYAKNGKGGFTEIPVPEVEPKYYEAMIGNRNYTLTVEDSELIAEWHDGSDRPLAPLKIRYMWANGGFRVVAINAPYTKR